ncbi:Autophagy- protein 2 [Desmophyllum pertusum]|uniref:Autophagy-related protein 2 n=1 Tax=Desmophyllum pertusum TaxID=174260 RepID=A0A9W9ZN83_9CNID|nr:Autophagy- protein 2 [Desmophyllum pertusum]
MECNDNKYAAGSGMLEGRSVQWRGTSRRYPAFEGLESFAQTIESVLARVKLSFTDTVIRFEHLPKDTLTGIGLEIHIRRIDYSDLSTELAERDSHYKAKSVYEPAACASEQFTTPPHSGSLLPPIKIATFAGHSEIKLKLKQNVAVPGPKMDVECFLGTLNVFLSPKQVHLLIELCSGFSAPDVSNNTTVKGQTVNKPMQPEDYQKIEQDLQNQIMSTKQQEQRHHQGQQRVDSWNFAFDSCGTNDTLSHYSSGTDYDSILGEEGEETFYSMSSNHDVLPPLGEPVLPADMLAVKSSGSLLQSPDFSALGTLGGAQSSPYNLMNTIGCDKRFVSQKVQIPDAPQSNVSRHSLSPLANPGLAE